MRLCICFAVRAVLLVASQELDELEFQNLLESIRTDPLYSPRSKLLSVLRGFKELQSFDPDLICERVLSDHPFIQMQYSILHRRVSEWGDKFQAASSVPEWFHWLHVAYHPELPSVETILSMAPPDYPLRGRTLRAVSSIWHGICLVDLENPCLYVSSFRVHGTIQSGFMMSSLHINRYLDVMIQRETRRLLSRSTNYLY